jgi:hypothetical protein
MPTALSTSLALLALAAAPAALGSPTPQLGGVGGPAAGMRYVPDPGIRMLGGQRPRILLDKDGRYWLTFGIFKDPNDYVTSCMDGLNFPPAQKKTDDRNNPLVERMPLPDSNGNPIFRKYRLDAPNAQIVSSSSTHGLYFQPDPGARYIASPIDNGLLGVSDTFVNRWGEVVLLYIGDMQPGGRNNVRTAIAVDNGWTFNLVDVDPFGDFNGPGRGESYVDPKALDLKNGRVRVFTMRQGPQPPQPGVRKVGDIYTFLTEDGGRTFQRDPGPVLMPEQFKEFDVWSLNDPMAVRLKDGRFRIYVAALIDDPNGPGTINAIVSATSWMR